MSVESLPLDVIDARTVFQVQADEMRAVQQDPLLQALKGETDPETITKTLDAMHQRALARYRAAFSPERTRFIAGQRP